MMEKKRWPKFREKIREKPEGKAAQSKDLSLSLIRSAIPHHPFDETWQERPRRTRRTSLHSIPSSFASRKNPPPFEQVFERRRRHSLSSATSSFDVRRQHNLANLLRIHEAKDKKITIPSLKRKNEHKIDIEFKEEDEDEPFDDHAAEEVKHSESFRNSKEEPGEPLTDSSSDLEVERWKLRLKDKQLKDKESAYEEALARCANQHQIIQALQQALALEKKQAAAQYSLLRESSDRESSDTSSAKSSDLHPTEERLHAILCDSSVQTDSAALSIESQEGDSPSIFEGRARGLSIESTSSSEFSEVAEVDVGDARAVAEAIESGSNPPHLQKLRSRQTSTLLAQIKDDRQLHNELLSELKEEFREEGSNRKSFSLRKKFSQILSRADDRQVQLFSALEKKASLHQLLVRASKEKANFQEKNVSLTAECSRLEMDLEEAKKLIEDLESTIMSTRKLLNNAQDEKNALITSLESMTANRDALAEELGSLEQHLKHRQSKPLSSKTDTSSHASSSSLKPQAKDGESSLSKTVSLTNDKLSVKLMKLCSVLSPHTEQPVDRWSLDDCIELAEKQKAVWENTVALLHEDLDERTDEIRSLAAELEDLKKHHSQRPIADGSSPYLPGEVYTEADGFEAEGLQTGYSSIAQELMDAQKSVKSSDSSQGFADGTDPAQASINWLKAQLSILAKPSNKAITNSEKDMHKENVVALVLRKVSQLNQDKLDLRAKLDAIKSKRKGPSSAALETSSTHAALPDEVDRTLMDVNFQLETEIREVKERNEEVELGLQEAVENHRLSEMMVARLREEMSQLLSGKSELESALEKSQFELEESVRKSNEQKSAFMSRNVELFGKLQEATDELTQYAQDKSQLEEEMVKLKDELASSSASMLDLKSQLERKAKEKEEAHAEKSHLQAENSILAAKLAHKTGSNQLDQSRTLSQTLQDLRATVSSLQVENMSLRADKDQSHQSLKQVQEELQQVKDSSRELIEQVQKLEAANKLLLTEKGDFGSETERALATMRQLKEEAARLTSEENRLRTSNNDLEACVNILKSENASLHELNSLLEKEREENHLETDKLQDEVKQLQGGKEELQAVNADLSNQVDRMEKELEHFQEEKSRITSESNGALSEAIQLKETVTRLQSNLDAEKTTKLSLEKKNAVLLEEKRKLHEEATIAQRDSALMMSERQQLEAELDGLKASCAELEEQRKVQSAREDRLASALSSSKSEKTALAQEHLATIAQLTSELTEERKKANVASAEAISNTQELQSMNGALQASNDELRRTYEEALAFRLEQEKKVSELEKLNADSAKANQSLQHNLEALQADRRALNALKTKAEEDNAVSLLHSRELEQANKELVEQKESLQVEVEELQVQLAHLTNSLKHAEKSKQDVDLAQQEMQSALTRIQRESSSAQRDLAFAIDNAKETEDKLVAEKQQVELELSRVVSESSLLQKETLNLSAENSKLEALNLELNQRLAASDESTHLLEKEVSSLEEKKEQLKSRLEAEMGLLRKDLDSATDEIARVEAEKADILATHEAGLSEVNQAKSKLEDDKCALGSTITKLESQLGELRRESAVLHENLSRLEAENLEAFEGNSRHQEAMSDLQKQLDISTDTTQLLTQEKRDLTVKIGALEEELKNTCEQSSRYKADMEKAVVDLTELQSDRHVLRQANATLEEEQLASASKKEELDHELAKALSRNNFLQEEKAKLEEKVKQLQEEKGRVKSSLEVEQRRVQSQLEQVEKTNAVLVEEGNELKRANQTLAAEKQHQLLKDRQMEQEMSQLAQSKEDLLQRMDELETQCSESEKRAEEDACQLREAAAAFDKEKSQLSADNAVLLSEKCQRETQVMKAEAEAGRLLEHIDHLQEKLLSLEASKKDATHQEQNSAEEKRCLEKLIDQLKSQLTIADSAKSQLEADLHNLEKQLRDNELDRNDLQAKLGVLADQKSQVEAGVEALQTQLQTLGQSKSQLEAELLNVQAQVEQSGTEKSQLEAKLSDLQSYVQNLEKQKSQHELDMRGFQTKLDEGDSIRVELEENLKRVEAELEQMTAEKHEEKDQLQTQLLHATQELERFSSQNLHLQSSSTNTQAALNSAELEVTEAKEIISEMKTKLDESAAAKVDLEERVLRLERDTLKERGEAAASLKALQEEKQRVEADAQSLQSKLASAMESRDLFEAEILILKAQLAEAAKEKKELDLQAIKLSEANNILESDADQLHHALTHTRSALANSRQESLQLKNAKRKLEEEVASLKADLVSIEEEKSQVEAACTKAKEQLCRTEEETDVLLQKKSHLNHDYSKVDSLQRDLTAKVEELAQENRALKDSLTTLQTQLIKDSDANDTTLFPVKEASLREQVDSQATSNFEDTSSSAADTSQGVSPEEQHGLDGVVFEAEEVESDAQLPQQNPIYTTQMPPQLAIVNGEVLSAKEEKVERLRSQHNADSAKMTRELEEVNTLLQRERSKYRKEKDSAMAEISFLKAENQRLHSKNARPKEDVEAFQSFVSASHRAGNEATVGAASWQLDARTLELRWQLICMELRLKQSFAYATELQILTAKLQRQLDQNDVAQKELLAPESQHLGQPCQPTVTVTENYRQGDNSKSNPSPSKSSRSISPDYSQRSVPQQTSSMVGKSQLNVEKSQQEPNASEISVLEGKKMQLQEALDNAQRHIMRLEEDLEVMEKENHSLVKAAEEREPLLHQVLHLEECLSSAEASVREIARSNSGLEAALRRASADHRSSERENRDLHDNLLHEELRFEVLREQYDSIAQQFNILQEHLHHRSKLEEARPQSLSPVEHHSSQEASSATGLHKFQGDDPDTLASDNQLLYQHRRKHHRNAVEELKPPSHSSEVSSEASTGDLSTDLNRIRDDLSTELQPEPRGFIPVAAHKEEASCSSRQEERQRSLASPSEIAAPSMPQPSDPDTAINLPHSQEEIVEEVTRLQQLSRALFARNQALDREVSALRRILHSVRSYFSSNPTSPPTSRPKAPPKTEQQAADKVASLLSAEAENLAALLQNSRAYAATLEREVSTLRGSLKQTGAACIEQQCTIQKLLVADAQLRRRVAYLEGSNAKQEGMLQRSEAALLGVEDIQQRLADALEAKEHKCAMLIEAVEEKREREVMLNKHKKVSSVLVKRLQQHAQDMQEKLHLRQQQVISLTKALHHRDKPPIPTASLTQKDEHEAKSFSDCDDDDGFNGHSAQLRPTLAIDEAKAMTTDEATIRSRQLLLLRPHRSSTSSPLSESSFASIISSSDASHLPVALAYHISSLHQHIGALEHKLYHLQRLHALRLRDCQRLEANRFRDVRQIRSTLQQLAASRSKPSLSTTTSRDAVATKLQALRSENKLYTTENRMLRNSLKLKDGELQREKSARADLSLKLKEASECEEKLQDCEKLCANLQQALFAKQQEMEQIEQAFHSRMQNCLEARLQEVHVQQDNAIAKIEDRHAQELTSVAVLHGVLQRKHDEVSS